ncbi:MAG: hypothetical protein WC449_04645 [Candidatus Paceibacterota bacterium]
MYYDSQIIYGHDDKTSFSWNGWTYYRTTTGKAKRHNDDSGKRESVKESNFIKLKNHYEEVMGVKLNV